MNVEVAMAEAERRLQAFVIVEEEEHIAREEEVCICSSNLPFCIIELFQLNEAIAYEQERNGILEQKAAEELMLLGQRSEVINLLVNEIKQRLSRDGMPGSSGASSWTKMPHDVASLLNEKNWLASKVSSLEQSYFELLTRYQTLRQASIDIRKNEETVRGDLKKWQQLCVDVEKNFVRVQQYAQQQLDLANGEIERLLKVHDEDTMALRLKVKHYETKNSAVMVALDAKSLLFSRMDVGCSVEARLDCGAVDLDVAVNVTDRRNVSSSGCTNDYIIRGFTFLLISLLVGVVPAVALLVTDGFANVARPIDEVHLFTRCHPPQGT
ncbi:unnamed protein product [Toxocara canis]|uniref:TACC_C domain-containing protein n=1 Tax=Toxocara canis TaxID=6265 RepID=A0A183UUP1_TOXCA|nr:unnamed protein product [Toxocara canis]